MNTIIWQIYICEDQIQDKLRYRRPWATLLNAHVNSVASQDFSEMKSSLEHANHIPESIQRQRIKGEKCDKRDNLSRDWPL